MVFKDKKNMGNIIFLNQYKLIENKKIYYIIIVIGKTMLNHLKTVILFSHFFIIY
jgi:hypothetical protein